MNERKNIDRLFQEKFKDFEAAPPETAWKNIESRLREDEDDRKVIPFWFRLSGIAAALLMGLFITNKVVDSNAEQENPNNSIVLDQQKQSPKVDQQEGSIREEVANGIQNDGTILDSASQNNAGDLNVTQKGRYGSGEVVNIGSQTTPGETRIKNPRRVNNSVKTGIVSSGAVRSPRNNADAITYKKTGRETKIAQHDRGEVDQTGSMDPRVRPNGVDGQLRDQMSNIAEKSLTTDNNTIAEIIPDIQKDTMAIATVVPNTLEELLNEKENNVTTNEPKLNRWQVSSNVAPIYFSSTSNGSPIDPALAQNSKDYKQNLAYGLGVRYAINNKLTVRTGVNTIGLEYDTNDVVFFQNNNARQLQNVNSNLQGSVIQIENKNAGQIPELTANDNILSKFDGNLNQKTGYIEVPVELSYKVFERRKFGLEVIGGMSTLFLNENEISVISAGTEMPIGKASNLNSTHFSTNFGLGVKYNIIKSIQLNVEPMLKYQINTFSDSGNFQPFIFGLYTGINYRF